jgi:hypothetical protein
MFLSASHAIYGVMPAIGDLPDSSIISSGHHHHRSVWRLMSIVKPSHDIKPDVVTSLHNADIQE